jgi:23S rRNA (cytosine1962-C5)-methyltransferase
MEKQPAINILQTDDWADYELVDSGNGAKLERFGAYTFRRPEHQAIWKPMLDQSAWRNLHAEFIATGEESGGHWKFNKPLPDYWAINYKDLSFAVRPSNSRHLGIFPEQASHWDWIRNQLKGVKEGVRVLNLFGYTGAASLVAAKAGAIVTHVDASKKTIGLARENQALSDMDNFPIRWIIDDALKFIRREARRGVRYHGIIMDPPKFGRGPNGEVWEFFDMFPLLLRETRNILDDKPLFIVITAYAIRASALTLYYALNELIGGYEGILEAGELAVKEKSGGRLLSLAIYSRWRASTNVPDTGRRMG